MFGGERHPSPKPPPPPASVSSSPNPVRKRPPPACRAPARPCALPSAPWSPRVGGKPRTRSGRWALACPAILLTVAALRPITRAMALRNLASGLSRRTRLRSMWVIGALMPSPPGTWSARKAGSKHPRQKGRPELQERVTYPSPLTWGGIERLSTVSRCLSNARPGRCGCRNQHCDELGNHPRQRSTMGPCRHLAGDPGVGCS